MVYNILLVSSPDPTLEEGRGSGELGLNLRFSFYGARCKAMRSLNLIGLYLAMAACVCDHDLHAVIIKQKLESDWSAILHILAIRQV